MERTLPPHEVTALAMHFYREGEAAYADHNYAHALVWYAQCLDALSQVEPEALLLADVLLNLSRIMVWLGAEALPFLEAAANVLNRGTPGPNEARLLTLIAEHLVWLGYPTKALARLERARLIYQALELTTEATETEHLIQQVLADTTHAARHLSALEVRNQAHTFAIVSGSSFVSTFTVYPDGTIHWQCPGIDRPITATPHTAWRVVCY